MQVEPGRSTAQPTMLTAGEGRRITGGPVDATLKVAGGQGALTSTFEVRVPPGFDVGAHYHTVGEELFYVITGELQLMAFKPGATDGHWSGWRAETGRTVLKGGPGALMHVPAGTPHAFRNAGSDVAVMLFQAAPSGHEVYFEKLATLLAAAQGTPDQQELAQLRSQYDVHQISDLTV